MQQAVAVAACDEWIQALTRIVRRAPPIECAALLETPKSGELDEIAFQEASKVVGELIKIGCNANCYCLALIVH